MEYRRADSLARRSLSEGGTSPHKSYHRRIQLRQGSGDLFTGDLVFDQVAAAITQGFGEQGLAGTGRSDQQNVALRQLDVTALAAVAAAVDDLGVLRWIAPTTTEDGQ